MAIFLEPGVRFIHLIPKDEMDSDIHEPSPDCPCHPSQVMEAHKEDVDWLQGLTCLLHHDFSPLPPEPDPDGFTLYGVVEEMP